MSRPILILSPTEPEISLFREVSPPDVQVEICGIGAVETAVAVAIAVAKHNPRMVILAGIAGTYKESRLIVGECVVVDSEIVADMGAFRADGFQPLFIQEYLCPYAEQLTEFHRVGSNSVSVCAAPFVEGSPTRKIENMEGAAFFALCGALGVPFLEVRAISNVVAADRKCWNIPLAAKQLRDTLIKLIDEINS